MHHNPEESLANLIHNLQHLTEAGKVKMPEESVRDIVAGNRQLTVDELLLIAELSGHTINTLLNHRLSTKFNKIKMLVMDCDGVLTDGGMTFTKNGDEIKRFNAKDGQGIKRLQDSGFLTGIISAGISTGLVEKRAEMLNIKHVYVGKRPKLEVLSEWMDELDLTFEQVAYIGDDISDLPILEHAGLAVCPGDAVLQVQEVSDLILNLPGGAGCVRELIDEHLLVE